MTSDKENVEPVTDISAQISPKLSQQLETEQGIVYTEGHFRKLYRGVLGMDDHIQSGVNAKLLDIRKRIEKLKELTQEQTGAYKYDACYDECLEIIDKELGEDFVKERGNEK